jgi:hypothetical protein
VREVRNCRYWPLIREIKPDGNVGDIMFIRPNKVDEHLAKRPYTRGWYQDTANLAEEGSVGPFNFSNETDDETHRIDEKTWKALKEEALTHNVDITDLTKTIPY